MDTVYRETLPNGLRIVGERMANYRSVSIGCWIKAGVVYEDPAAGEHGVSHFIEHMLFKGTEKRSAKQIAEEIDLIGGNLNAFTAKECTCFYVKVLEENLFTAVELLSDLVCRSRLDPGDIENEKGVVIEEIAMNEDTPEDLVHERLCTLWFGSDPLARPVLGTEESVSAFTRARLTGYMARRYRPENIVIAAAGNFDPAALRDAVGKSFLFGGAGGETPSSAPAGDGAGHGGSSEGGESRLFIEKDIEQTHIAMAFPGFSTSDERKFPLYMLNNTLGGSVSSRLFQNIREKRGLAYSVYSSPSCYGTGGYFTLYAGTGEKQAEQVAELMLEEYARIGREGITEDELERSKKQTRTGLLLGGESTSAHASSLGRAELFGVKYYNDDEIIALINGLTVQSVNGILPEVCDLSRMKACVVGKTGEGIRAALKR